MTPAEIEVYAAGIAAAQLGKRDPRFVALLVCDVIALGERMHGPSQVFGDHGTTGDVLVRVAGLDSLEQVPKRPRPPDKHTVDTEKAYTRELALWSARARRAEALLALHRKRLTGLLNARRDYEWLCEHHPKLVASMPKSTAAEIGRLLEAFGATSLPYLTSSDIWRSAREWPRNAAREQRLQTKPWQDASGWEE